MSEITLNDLETPCLLLDRELLEVNAARMLAVAVHHEIRLRPHVKTSKCAEIADIMTGGLRSRITVSTLEEATTFARAGFTDMLYAVGVSVGKFPRIAELINGVGADLTLITDSVDVAKAAVAFTDANDVTFRFLIEFDCGEHRGGLDVDDPDAVEIARILADGERTELRGVMTHAGHSYATNDLAEIQKISATEVAVAVKAAETIRRQGIDIDVVSIGSTPTVIFGKDFNGVTELRAGIYAFYDLSQWSRKVCRREDIALSVLATVIGHNKPGKAIVVDAGALALSKDLGANTFMPGTAYGPVCNPETLNQYEDLVVEIVHQEHGTIPIPDDYWFERLPVGAKVRILPNHACLTAAAHTSYTLIQEGYIMGQWERSNGW